MNQDDIQFGWTQVNEHRSFYWHYTPNAPAKGAVLLVPPIGHEAFHANRFYNLLARFLQKNGFEVIRIDLIGFGNSSGESFDESAPKIWLQQIEHSIKLLTTDVPLTLLGLRFGANLCSYASADHFLFIDPIMSTNRYVREIKVAAKFSETQNSSESAIESGGFSYSEEMLEWIKTHPLNLEHSESFGSLITKYEDTQFTEITSFTQFNYCLEPNIGDVLAEPQFTKIPTSLFSLILNKINQVDTIQCRPRHTSVEIESSIQLGTIKETTYRDKKEQFGILCEPTTKHDNRLLVLINSGSGPHHGPNRLYVETNRLLANRGIRTLRIDLLNLGDSATAEVPDENHCYPKASVEYCLSILDRLAIDNISTQVTLAGVCSGAHHAFHAAVKNHPSLERVVLINPLTFYWHEGMSLVTPQEQAVTIDSSYYSQTIKDPKAWLKLFKGKADFKYIASFILRFTKKLSSRLFGKLRDAFKPMPKTQFNRDLKLISDRNTQVYFIISDSDPGWGLIADASELSFKKLKKKFGVHGVAVANSNHTFSKKKSRINLADSLEEILSTEESSQQS
jgi:pimeloyl-ACP methyl ester carboxylesterase